jgi:hypothetical protein
MATLAGAGMRLFRRSFFALVAGAAIAASEANGQSQLIIQEWVSVSQAVAGNVDIGSAATPAEGVTVDLCSPGWKAVLSSTKTDRGGHFSLSAPATARLYYLRLSGPGVNPYQLRVRLRKDAPRELRIRLELAT